jgi:hypothetical protein
MEQVEVEKGKWDTIRSIGKDCVEVILGKRRQDMKANNQTLLSATMNTFSITN